MNAPMHVYEILIKASPEVVWKAMIDPEYTTKYFHGTRFDSTFERGATYRNVIVDGGRPAVDGVIEEFDPPRRLVLTWHVLYDVDMAQEPPSRVEWDLAPANADRSVTRLTLRHCDLGMSPLTWANVRLGWVGVLDGMKTLIETGEPLGDVTLTDESSSDVDGEWHRSLGVKANNSVWDLLGQDVRTATDDEDMLQGAYASRYHWARAARRGPANVARGAWMLSRVWAVLADGATALRYGDECLAVCNEHTLEDFDLAYAHEARARALACLGRFDEARPAIEAALAVEISDAEDRSIFNADLRAEPWFGFIHPTQI